MQKHPIFGFSCSYLKNGLGDPNFSLHKSDQQAKMKLSAKFKRQFVKRIQSYLKVSISLGGSKSDPQNLFLKVCRKFHSGMLITFHKVQETFSDP